MASRTRRVSRTELGQSEALLRISFASERTRASDRSGPPAKRVVIWDFAFRIWNRPIKYGARGTPILIAPKLLMTVRPVSRTATVVRPENPPFLAVGMTTPFGRRQPRKLLSVDGAGARWFTNHAAPQPRECQHRKHLIRTKTGVSLNARCIDRCRIQNS